MAGWPSCEPRFVSRVAGRNAPAVGHCASEFSDKKPLFKWGAAAGVGCAHGMGTMPNKLLFLIGLLFFLVPSTTKAATVSTGDLGLNVITAAGAYEWSPTVSSLTNGLPATLAVTYGLWNDPPMTVHASVNGTEVGSFLVNVSFFDGAVTTTFSFSNLLVEGANTIRLDGLGENEGEYVISQIDLTYNIPLPPTEPPSEPPSGPSITKVLHYLNRPTLTPAVAGSSVSGSVRLQLNEQGGSSLQKLDLSAVGLQPNTDYALIVALREDPNTNSVGTVTSDSHGRVRVSLGEGGEALPAGLDPVTDIRGLGLGTSAGTETIAWSVINTSSKFQYLVERILGQQDTNATPVGAISLEANASSVNFNLQATGLSASSTYHLALNGTVALTATSDSEGALELTTWPAGAPAVLDLRSLALLDGSNNVVLSTTLPK